MNIKIIPIKFLSIKTRKMLKKDIPIVLQNINTIGRHFFLLFKKSTTFWDNPRICVNHLQRNSTFVKISTGRDNSCVCMYPIIYIFLHH